MTSQPQPKITLVVAGSYRQFVEWCYENSRSPYDRYVRFVNHEHQLMGYTADSVELVYYGTWEDGPLFRGRNRTDPERKAHVMHYLKMLEGVNG